MTFFSVIPPPGLVLLAIVAIQLGAALAAHLFPILGPNGTVAIRILISAFVLVFFARSRIFTFGSTFRENWALLLGFGLCLASMNIFFYQAIARIPLGTTVAIEFMGPLGVAVLNSRKLSHFAWITLAAVGIALLSPLTGVELDMMGVMFALLAGLGWALFIIIAGHVGKQIPGSDGLAIAMVIAAIVMIPFAIPAIPTLVFNPLILLAAIVVALLSTTIPMTFEFEALKHLPARNYGVLVSLEPGVAAMVGALLLGERMGAQGMVAVACVVVAAIGITVTDNKSPS
ncbi:EamA family transporter [Granulosicoccus sp.]|nr:EamA family transporter [Granulosicoccus sp.]MDB4223810.1 EamA family transporter [Granulosicoccus sp.]